MIYVSNVSSLKKNVIELLIKEKKRGTFPGEVSEECTTKDWLPRKKMGKLGK